MHEEIVELLEPESSGELDLMRHQVLASQGSRFLYRGQVKDYVFRDGLRSLSSSIERAGCVPPLMFKWSFSASQILHHLRGPDRSPTGEETLAVLQHYGWRSFFLDLTASFPVAAWFASHQYRNGHAIHQVEDCYETGLAEVHRTAEYKTPVQDFGYVYVFDRRAVDEDQRLHLHDVASLVDGLSPRANHQRAWVVSADAWPSLSPRLNRALAYVVKAPVVCLAKVAQEEGLTQKDLFPSSEEDIVMRLLLSLPRTEIRVGDEREGVALFPAYRMALDVPEYDEPFRKRHPPNIAFDQNRWLSDLLPDLKREGNGEDRAAWDSVRFIRAEQPLFFATSDIQDPSEGVAVQELIGSLRDFIIEVNALIPVYPDADKGEYVVGVHSYMVDDLVAISSISIIHPGENVTGAGESYPRFYKVDEQGYLAEVPHPESCPCNNRLKHDLLVATVKRAALQVAGGAADLVAEKGKQYLRFKPVHGSLAPLARRGYGLENTSEE